MTEPTPYSPGKFDTDAVLAALALLRTRLEADPLEAAASCIELIDAWTERFGEGGLRLLAAQLVEQAVTILPGDPHTAADRLTTAEMDHLIRRPAF
jgi:hypothetical protein